MHNVHIDLTIVITIYKLFINYIMDLKNSIPHYEKFGMDKTGIQEYKVSGIKNRKMPYDESFQDDTGFLSRKSFNINIFYIILDSSLTKLRK